MTKKIIISVLSVLFLTVIGCFIGLNWKGLKTIMSGAQIYTKSQMEESYNQGYEDANTNEKNYLAQIEYYKGIVEDNKLQIQNLNNSITILKNSNETYRKQITHLQTTNADNQQTINNLQDLIKTNDIAIYELETQISNYETQVANLQKSIAYYEEYISSLENDTQVVATFEYDGSVYNLQVLNKGSYASVVSPTSTEYVVFNGWTVDGQIVDLNTYAVTKNTKFVADLSYKYDVNFIVDGETANSQIVSLNSSATLPTVPAKDGYEFDGWTLDGVNTVDVSTYAITSHTNFYALFTKLHIVTFVYEEDILSTQVIRNEEFAENVAVESTTYKVFNGWTIGNIITDVETYSITSTTTFIADITYKYDADFIVDGTTYDSQVITKNGCPAVPTAPTKENYNFIGWSIDGTNVVNVSSYAITENTNFVAIFEIALDRNGTFEVKIYDNGVHECTFEFVIENDVYKSCAITYKENNYASIQTFDKGEYELGFHYSPKMLVTGTSFYLNYSEETHNWYLAHISLTSVFSSAEVVRK